jgi:hypothetical protein
MRRRLDRRGPRWRGFRPLAIVLYFAFCPAAGYVAAIVRSYNPGGGGRNLNDVDQILPFPF